MVSCQICGRFRTYSKYKRHLQLHLRDGEVSSEYIEELIFQTKYSRSDTSNATYSVRIGRVCSICSARVLNLRTHVTRQHGYSRNDKLYDEIFKESEYCERQSHYKDGNEVNINPLFNYSALKFKIDGNSISNVVKSSTPKKPEINNCDLHYDHGQSEANNSDSLYDFPDSDDDEKSDGVINPASIHGRITKDVSEAFINAIWDFRCFLATDWGGAKLRKSINMDVSNLCQILNSVGENDFWNANSLNTFFSGQGKKFTPITVHSRVRSFRRFLEYLCGCDSNLIPKETEIRRIHTMIDGVEKSLLRKRDSRMKIVMARNRDCYSQTLEVLKMWRKERVMSNQLNLIKLIHNNPNLSIGKESYAKMRNFLICECIIPNGQRSGVISGMLVQEVISARNQKTARGHHRIMVAQHKTGSIQCATLFVYPNVYRALKLFVQSVLPRLPVYLSKSAQLSGTSPLFQTITGNAIATSLVTPYVRSALEEMGIAYSGTITDFRRAAATLTGQQMPSLTDKMAQFLGHSRRVHEKHYRVQYGHFGLIEAFLQLESMQSNPTTEENVEQDVDENVSDDNDVTICVSSQSSPNPVLFSTPHVFSGESSEVDRNMDTMPIQSTEVNPSSLDSSPISLHEFTPCTQQVLKKCSVQITRISIAETLFQPIIPHDDDISESVDLSPETSCSSFIHPSSSAHFLSMGSSSISSDELTTAPKGNNMPVITSSSKQKCVKRGSKHRKCLRNDLPNKRPTNSLSEVDTGKISSRSIFVVKSDESLFLDVFNDFIDRVVGRRPLAKSEVVHRANSDVFLPVITRLKTRYTGDVYTKLYNRIRTIANLQRGILPGAAAEAEHSFHTAHHKSIFQLRKDELVFSTVFSNLIRRVADRLKVTKREILERAYTNVEFSPLLTKFKLSYTTFEIERMVFNKVRTLGNASRKPFKIS